MRRLLILTTCLGIQAGSFADQAADAAATGAAQGLHRTIEVKNITIIRQAEPTPQPEITAITNVMFVPISHSGRVSAYYFGTKSKCEEFIRGSSLYPKCTRVVEVQ